MHEHIYHHDQYAGVGAKEFIPAIVEGVRKAYGSSLEIRYEVDTLHIDRDRATPLALLLSELATNAFKYAFPTGPGALNVSLQREDEEGRAILVFRDNGVGMLEPSVEKSRSMGMRLVKASVAQMDGSFLFANDAGTVFRSDLALDIRSAELAISRFGRARAH